MDNPRIELSDCTETLNGARQIINDKRIGTYASGSPYSTTLSNFKETATSILEFAGRNSYLTQKQVDYLKKMWNYYQKIVNFNQEFGEGLSDSAATLLEESIKLAEPYVKFERSLMYRKVAVSQRKNQIRKGEYFWNIHIEPAKKLLEQLNTIGVNTGDLEERIDSLMQRVSIGHLFTN